MAIDETIVFKILELLVAMASIAVIEFLGYVSSQPIIIFGTVLLCTVVSVVAIISAIIDADVEKPIEVTLDALCALLCIATAVLDFMEYDNEKDNPLLQYNLRDKELMSLGVFSAINAIIFSADIFYKYKKH